MHPPLPTAGPVAAWIVSILKVRVHQIMANSAAPSAAPPARLLPKISVCDHDFRCCLVTHRALYIFSISAGGEHHKPAHSAPHAAAPAPGHGHANAHQGHARPHRAPLPVPDVPPFKVYVKGIPVELDKEIGFNQDISES
jgi:hypothetical protein